MTGHPCSGLVSLAFTVAAMFAPVSAQSLGRSPGADADCGSRRRYLKDGRSCVGFVVDD